MQGKSNLKSRIQKLEKLGEGSYGKVYRVFDRQRNQIFAMKKIKLSADDEGIPSTTLREITLLRETEHENIVHLYDLLYFFKERKLYLLFEYMDLDLRKFLDSRTLELANIKQIFLQLVEAIDHLHEHHIFHRDLKPQNILTNNEGTQLKVADFGLARHFNVPFRQYSKEIVTLWYRAPEVIMGSKNYGIGVDIWSVGCIFYELFFRKPLFMGDCQVQTLFLIFKKLGTPDDDMWPGIREIPDYTEKFPRFKAEGFDSLLKSDKMNKAAVDLLSKMLALDPLKRITCREIKQHEFFK